MRCTALFQPLLVSRGRATEAFRLSLAETDLTFLNHAGRRRSVWHFKVWSHREVGESCTSTVVSASDLAARSGDSVHFTASRWVLISVLRVSGLWEETRGSDEKPAQTQYMHNLHVWTLPRHWSEAIRRRRCVCPTLFPFSDHYIFSPGHRLSSLAPIFIQKTPQISRKMLYFFPTKDKFATFCFCCFHTIF